MGLDNVVGAVGTVGFVVMYMGVPLYMTGEVINNAWRWFQKNPEEFRNCLRGVRDEVKKEFPTFLKAYRYFRPEQQYAKPNTE